MAVQTQVDLEDIQELQKHLAQFVETLRTELRQVESQWIKLKDTWHDDNCDEFVSNFLERFQSDTNQVLFDFENHESTLRDKVRTIEGLQHLSTGSIIVREKSQTSWEGAKQTIREGMKQAARNLAVAVEVAQTVSSVLGGSPFVQAIIASSTVPNTLLTSEVRTTPKFDDPLAKTEEISAMPVELELLQDWKNLQDDEKKRYSEL